MKTKTITKRIDNLSPADYLKCSRLNFRAEGLMQEDLSRLREDSKWTDGSTDARIIMIKDEDDKLLSWSLVEPRLGDDDSAYSAQFYTRVSARGRGYGKRLMRQVLKIDNNPWVYPHDKRSGDFFKNYKQSVRVSTISSGWLTDEKED